MPVMVINEVKHKEGSWSLSISFNILYSCSDTQCISTRWIFQIFVQLMQIVLLKQTTGSIVLLLSFLKSFSSTHFVVVPPMGGLWDSDLLHLIQISVKGVRFTNRCNNICPTCAYCILKSPPDRRPLRLQWNKVNEFCWVIPFAKTITICPCVTSDLLCSHWSH